MIEFAERAQAVFLNALDISSPEVRCAYIDAECRDDESLRREVEGLLDHADRVGDFLGDVTDDDSAMEQTTDAFSVTGKNSEPIPQTVGKQIGQYKIREKIAEGGMGAVYVAEQSKPVRRKVALKLIRPGMAGPNVVARFEAERQALAMMDHPNIARVLDGGATEDQLPYFVMELVQGLPITEYCDAKRLTTRERLELFIDVCRAVQHAHQKGIIHRDLKPSNILVAEIDGKAVPKVIDFGVAKALHQKLTDQTVYTQFSQMVGTPLYMSPEQAAMGVVDVDTRSDVYSLGVVLYELLTGETPFDRDVLKNATFDEMRRIIREQEPQRPSAMVSTLKAEAQSTIADKRCVDARKLHNAIAGELDWLVMQTLEKDRSRRYESASALAEDVRRYLDDEPVEACPPSVVYRMKKVTSRHKRLLAGAAVIVAVLFVATVFSTYAALKADRERSNAKAAEQQASQNLYMAIESIDKLLQQASSSELTEIPQAQVVRKQILEDVLAFYDNLRSTAEHTPAVRYRAAMSWKQLAALSGEFGDYDRAKIAFRKALSLVTQLDSEFPDNRDYQSLLIDTLYRFGAYQAKLGRLKESRRYREQTLSFIDALRSGPLAHSDQVAGIKLVCLWSLGNQGLVTEPEQRNEYATAAVQFAETQQANKSDEGCYGLRLVAMSLADSDPVRAEKFFHWIIENSESWNASGSSRIMLSGRIDNLDSALRFFRYRDGAMEAELAIEQLELADQLAVDFPNREWNQTRQMTAIARIYALREDRVDRQGRDVSTSQDDLREPLLRRLKSAPNHHRTHLMRAVYLSRSKDPIKSLTDAIAEYPMQSAYREFRGSIFLDRMEFEKGVEDLSAALAIVPEPVRLHSEFAWHSRRFTKFGRPEQGMRLIETVHGFGTATSATEQALAMALTKLGRHGEAKQHLENAEKLTLLGTSVRASN